MSLTEKQKHDLKKFIKELEEYRGRHTELVSVYVPAGYQLVKIIQHLQQEQGTAKNIKSTATRNNVIDALEKMVQHLRVVDKTPQNGLAAFAGNVAAREGQQDYLVKSIEPPVPLNMRDYRCDKEFRLDILRDMLNETEIYGLVVMDRRDARIGILKGKSIINLVKTHSEVPGKFRAGGQSAQRFARQREGAARDHYNKVGEYMKEQFLTMEGLKGILVGGPGPTKYDFVDGNHITNEVKKKIIGIKDLSYTDEYGLIELVEKSEDVLANEEVMKEKKIMAKFFDLLAKRPSMVAYGIKEVRDKVGLGVADTVLISEAMEENVIEEIEELAKQFSTQVQIISVETREGVQLKDIGRICAILRYETFQ